MQHLQAQKTFLLLSLIIIIANCGPPALTSGFISSLSAHPRPFSITKEKDLNFNIIFKRSAINANTTRVSLTTTLVIHNAADGIVFNNSTTGTIYVNPEEDFSIQLQWSGKNDKRDPVFPGLYKASITTRINYQDQAGTTVFFGPSGRAQISIILKS